MKPSHTAETARQIAEGYLAWRQRSTPESVQLNDKLCGLFDRSQRNIDHLVGLLERGVPEVDILTALQAMVTMNAYWLTYARSQESWADWKIQGLEAQLAELVKLVQIRDARLAIQDETIRLQWDLIRSQVESLRRYRQDLLEETFGADKEADNS